jgi:formyltetrahydrofolate-dependent phosphoribosylglycinamide formyltransferase
MGNSRVRIAVFLSGGGSNLQALLDATKTNQLTADIVWVVSSNPKAYGLMRAQQANIPTAVFQAKALPFAEQTPDFLLQELNSRNVEYIALAGYLKLLPNAVVQKYRGKIVNIHPGKLPKYGGKGMYGHHVHEAVIANKETETAVTVHLVDEIYDHGRVLDTTVVPVLPDDTAETLAARVLVQEHLLYPRVLQKLISGGYDA